MKAPPARQPSTFGKGFQARGPEISSAVREATHRLLRLDLKRNTAPLRWSSLASLGLLFLPAVLFGLGLVAAQKQGFAIPWQFYALALCGLVATLGGLGDWWFHKVYVTVGPHEHHSHLWALGGGSLVFALMAAASLSARPGAWLLPIQVALLATVTLICYDEFQFHARRCRPFETALHRMLVFGNGAALLCWMHWLFA